MMSAGGVHEKARWPDVVNNSLRAVSVRVADIEHIIFLQTGRQPSMRSEQLPIPHATLRHMVPAAGFSVEPRDVQEAKFRWVYLGCTDRMTITDLKCNLLRQNKPIASDLGVALEDVKL
jgi:hypothetical protein